MHCAPALQQRASRPTCPALHSLAVPPHSEAVAYALYMTTNTFLAAAVVAAVLFYGGTLVLRGAMSAGSLVSFMLFQQSLSSAFQVGGMRGAAEGRGATPGKGMPGRGLLGQGCRGMHTWHCRRARTGRHVAGRAPLWAIELPCRELRLEAQVHMRYNPIPAPFLPFKPSITPLPIHAQALGDVFSALSAAVGAADKVIELMKRPPAVAETGTLAPAQFQGKITLQVGLGWVASWLPWLPWLYSQ